MSLQYLAPPLMTKAILRVFGYKTILTVPPFNL